MILNEEETNKLLDREKKGENLTWNKNEFIDWFGDSIIKEEDKNKSYSNSTINDSNKN